MDITHLTPMSPEAVRDLQAMRLEMKQDKPDTDKLFNLISGTKYTVSIRN